MKAIIKPHRGVGLELANVPIPQAGDRDVLIKIAAASICGSDIPIYTWDDPWVRETVKPGQIVGHEFCGTVVGFGKDVQGFAHGDLVTAEGHVKCGVCFHCRTGEGHLCPNLRLIGFDYPGAFAEYIVVPASNVIKLMDLPVSLAAILDPFGNAVHASMRTELTGAVILVTGCGPIGLMAIALAKAAGANRIFATDISSYRLALAVQMGASVTLNPNEVDVVGFIKEETVTHSGVDVLLEMSGSEHAIHQGFKLLRNGGNAVLMGLPKEPFPFDLANDVIVRGITVHGLCGRVLFKTWYQAQSFLMRRPDGTRQIDLTSMITHRMIIDQFESAIHLMRNHQCGKIILFMDEDSLQTSQ